jgi:uncharacterized protein YwlG (UPF0340 family)
VYDAIAVREEKHGVRLLVDECEHLVSRVRVHHHDRFQYATGIRVRDDPDAIARGSHQHLIRTSPPKRKRLVP